MRFFNAWGYGYLMLAIICSIIPIESISAACLVIAVVHFNTQVILDKLNQGYEIRKIEVEDAK